MSNLKTAICCITWNLRQNIINNSGKHFLPKICCMDILGMTSKMLCCWNIQNNSMVYHTENTIITPQQANESHYFLSAILHEAILKKKPAFINKVFWITRLNYILEYCNQHPKRKKNENRIILLQDSRYNIVVFFKAGLGVLLL